MTPFLNWWVGQLTGLLPARLLDAYIESGDATILELGGDGFILHVRRGGILERAGEGQLCALAQVMASAPNLPQLKLLQIPGPYALRKTLFLPYAARNDLQNVLGFEIDRETPFEQGEIYWTHTVAGHDSSKSRLEIELVILPRRVGDAAAAAAREAGFHPAALAVTAPRTKTALLWLDTTRRLRLPRIPSGNRRLMTALYGLGAAVLLVPLAVQQVHFLLADRTIAALEAKARAASTLHQAANRRVAAMEFMGRKNGANGSALKILLAATKTLPDDTFLTAFSIHDGQVTMAGASEVAANLIKAVAQSPAFRDPVFESAVLEDPDSDRETFTISAKLAGAP